VRRGQIWRITGLRGDRLVLIVSADEVVEIYPTVQAAPIYEDADLRQTMVTVRLVTDKVAGVVKVVDVAPVLRDKFTEHVGDAPAYVMDQVSAALRTLYGLI
jgi:mRNA-degrading endonuclease toxin of MazEF toxin-antitoxin module